MLLEPLTIANEKLDRHHLVPAQLRDSLGRTEIGEREAGDRCGQA